MNDHRKAMNGSWASFFFFVLISWVDFGSLSAQEMPKGVVFSKHHYLPGYAFKKMAHPDIFLGNRKRRKYFEGWYFKMVSADGASILSVIPGISLSRNGKEQHAFIQIIDGRTAQTDYYSFPIEEFVFSKKEFAIRIGQNYFSKDKIKLEIKTDSSSVYGEILLKDMVELPPRKILNPGIMGWYRYVPFMQCYHGVVSLTHQTSGYLVRNGQEYRFDGGAGYIEKDWGRSMPDAWIWMQSNNFSQGNSSFMLSVANIPWLGKSFTGFLGFFLHGQTIYRFATYTHAHLKLENHQSDTVLLRITDRKYNYTIEAIRNNSGLLKAPVRGSMDRRIPESIDAQIRLVVRDKKGILIFNDSTSIAGLELVGDQETLSKKLKN